MDIWFHLNSLFYDTVKQTKSAESEPRRASRQEESLSLYLGMCMENLKLLSINPTTQRNWESTSRLTIITQ